MAMATITAQVDEDDKMLFNALCEHIGLDPSTAINVFVKAVVRERRIPFELRDGPDPFYDPANQA